jgi:hypothetical protein
MHLMSTPSRYDTKNAYYASTIRKWENMTLKSRATWPSHHEMRWYDTKRHPMKNPSRNEEIRHWKCIPSQTHHNIRRCRTENAFHDQNVTKWERDNTLKEHPHDHPTRNGRHNDTKKAYYGHTISKWEDLTLKITLHVQAVAKWRGKHTMWPTPCT